MKKLKKATSIAEAMIVMFVITIWITWMYRIYSKSVKFETTIANKIQAIQIAREWIEAVTNIRNTNWILFSWEYKKCWNTFNYDPLCIWSSTNKISHNWKYKIYKDNKWKLYSPTWVLIYKYTDETYRNKFRIWIDSDWFYTATWTITNLKPIFTREIRTNYIDTSDPTNWEDINDEKIKIKSIVSWIDDISNKPHKVELETILSNWKE